MHTTIKKLLTTLDKEADCYRDMKKILSDEEDAMQLSTKARFELVQEAKETMVGKLQAFEKKRKILVDQLSEAYTTEPEPMTVRQLVPFIKPPYDEKLSARANRLRTIIAEVEMKNRRNQLLISQYLGLIEGSLKLLTNLIEDNPIYQKPGTHQSAAGYQRRGGRLICGTI